MIMIITLCYLGCVYTAFKVIKIEVKPATIAVATLTGVFILGGIVIAWKFSAPITGQMTVTRPVVPLSTSQNTKEVIKKIHVKMDQPVKKGDLLYELETAPFQYTVDQRTAQLAQSEKQVLAQEASVEVAVSKVEQAKAGRAEAKANLDVVAGIQKDDRGAVSRLKVEVQRLSYKSASAAVDVALSSQKNAEFALASAREQALAARARLGTAQLDLERAFIRAPADGFIMNWQATEGTMTTTVITSAQGAFQDITRTRVLAVFRQNLLKNVESGDTVEIAFKSFPNHIATGTVDTILEFTGEGQLTTTGVLPSAASVGSKGFLAVRITLDDDEFAREVPLGAAGTTAIYTKFGGPFHIITKITLRIKSLLYNLPI